MPIPDGLLDILKYVRTDGVSRACPICGAPMEHITDGLNAINKCFQCGFSEKPTGDVSDQHKYDHTITIVTAFLQKQGFFELYQPLDEKLFNSLISAGRDTETARKEVIRDLDLKGEALEYFNSKVDFLGNL
jgi:hypothetical protein